MKAAFRWNCCDLVWEEGCWNQCSPALKAIWRSSFKKNTLRKLKFENWIWSAPPLPSKKILGLKLHGNNFKVSLIKMGTKKLYSRVCDESFRNPGLFSSFRISWELFRELKFIPFQKGNWDPGLFLLGTLIHLSIWSVQEDKWSFQDA